MNGNIGLFIEIFKKLYTQTIFSYFISQIKTIYPAISIYFRKSLILQTKYITNIPKKPHISNSLIKSYFKIISRKQENRELVQKLQLFYKQNIINNPRIYGLVCKTTNYDFVTINKNRYPILKFEIQNDTKNMLVSLNIFKCNYQENKYAGFYGGEIKNWIFDKFLSYPTQEILFAAKNITNYVNQNSTTIELFSDFCDKAKYDNGVVKFENVFFFNITCLYSQSKNYLI